MLSSMMLSISSCFFVLFVQAKFVNSTIIVTTLPASSIICDNNSSQFISISMLWLCCAFSNTSFNLVGACAIAVAAKLKFFEFALFRSMLCLQPVEVVVVEAEFLS